MYNSIVLKCGKCNNLPSGRVQDRNAPHYGLSQEIELLVCFKYIFRTEIANATPEHSMEPFFFSEKKKYMYSNMKHYIIYKWENAISHREQICSFHQRAVELPESRTDRQVTQKPMI